MIDIMKEVLFAIILMPYFLFIVLPKQIWDNRKLCPYWNYPYCKKNSLVTEMKSACMLGDAKNNCLHFNSNNT